MSVGAAAAEASSNATSVVGIQVQSSTATITTGFNFSLLKIQTLLQLGAGIFITASVVVATGLAFTVFGLTVKPDYPDPLPDFRETYKVTPVIIDVLANDKDPRQSNLTISSTTTPLHGTVAIIGKKTLRYIPNKYFSGVDKFNYTCMNDKYGASAEVTVTVRNHPPESVPQEYQVDKNKKDFPAKVFSYVDAKGGKIVDVDDDILTITSFTTPSHGTARTDGTVLYYSPSWNFNGVDTLNCTVSDGDDTTTFPITFTIFNSRPEPQPDTYIRPKNILQVLTVMDNDIDINNDELNITWAKNAIQGGVRVTTDFQAVEYLPLRSFKDYTDSFEYEVTDGFLTGQTYAVITMKNTPPATADSVITVAKNSKDNLVPLTYTDSDPYDGVTLDVTGAPKGSWQLSVVTTQQGDMFLGDRWVTWDKNVYTLKFSPMTGKVYQDSVKVTVSDSAAKTTGTITVNVINTAPVAVDDTIACPKRKSVDIDVLANDSDPNGDDLLVDSLPATTTANGGTVAIKAGAKQITYTAPSNGFTGADSFTYVIKDVQEKDSDHLTATAKVTVNVFNQPPVGVDDGPITAHKGIALAIDVLANDYDPNDDALSLLAGSVSTPTLGGSASITTVSGKDQITFTGTFVGPNPTDYEVFTYKLKDEAGLASDNSATVKVKVVNDAPVAIADTASVHWNNSIAIDVLANDNDPNPGDKALLTIVANSVSSPANGIVVVSTNGKSLTYKPNAGFVGTDSFSYKATDQTDQSAAATVTVSVTNEAPTAAADSFSKHHRVATAFFDVLANDGDASNDPIQLVSVATPNHGGSASVVQQNGKSYVQYSSASGFSGTETFSYTITDWNAYTVGQVSVSVTDTAPVANPDSVTVAWNGALTTFNVLSNDVDADSDPISIVSVTPRSGFQGTVSLVNAGVGTVSFQPSNNFRGDQFVDYVITDGAKTASGVITISVTNANRPSAPTISQTVHWRTAQAGITIPVLSSSTDADGDSLTLTLVGTVPAGLSVASNGRDLQYTNAAVGTFNFQYKVSDGLLSDDATSAVCSITVTNAAPVAAALSGTVPYAQMASGITFDVLSVATDSDSADVPFLSISNAGSSAFGTISQPAPGQIKFVPSGYQSTPIQFTYTVSDGKTTGSGTITVTTAAQILSNQQKSYSFHFWSVTGNGQDLNVLSGIPGSGLQVLSITSQPESGVATRVSSNTKINYKQTTPQTGTFTIQGTYGDGVSASQTIVVYVTVTNTAPSVSAISLTRKWSQLIGNGINFNATASVTDADGDFVSITTVPASTSKATLTKNSPSQGFITYKATAPFAGVDSFSAQVSDGAATVTLPVSITSTNTLPSTSQKTYNIHWREHVAGKDLPVTSGDSDADGDTVTLSSVSDISDPNSGTIQKSTTTANNVFVQAAAGSTSFVNKMVTFTYTVSDGFQTASNGVKLTVYNTAPSCPNSNTNTHWSNFQGAQVFNVIAGCTDADSLDAGNLIVSGVSATALGSGQSSVTISSDKKSITYTPPAKKAISDSFTVSVTDGRATVTATYSIVLTNNAPVINGVTTSVAWSATKAITPTCTDVDSDTLTWSIGSSPTQGTTGGFNAATGAITYTPSSPVYTLTPDTDGKYKATDSFTLQCSDGVVTVSTTIQVTIFNTPPGTTTVTQSYGRTNPVTPRTIDYVGALSADPEGNALTIISAQLQTASGATVSVANNKVNYVPPFSFAGTDSIKVTVSDGNLQSSGFISITMTNNAPVCSDIVTNNVAKATQTASISLTSAGCTDANGDTLTYATVASGNAAYCKKGTLSVSGTTVKYTPNAGRSGQDTCGFTVSDGFTSVQQNLVFNIVNRAPNAPAAKPYSFPKKATAQTLTLSVMDSTSDPDTGDTVSFVQLNDPNNCLAAAGSFSWNGASISYTPTIGWYGSTCTFTYTFKDSDQDASLTQTGSVSLILTNSAPVAVDDSFSQDNSPGSSGAFSVAISTLLANDYDVNSDAITFVNFFCPAGDSSYCQRQPSYANGNTYIVLPVNLQSCDTVRFKYTIQTADGLQSTATVTVKYSNCVCYKPMDIMFILDGSGSISSTNWQRARSFVSSIASKFTISSTTGARIGVTQFARGVSATYDTAQFCRYDYTCNCNWRYCTLAWCCDSMSKLGFPLLGTTTADIQGKATSLTQMASSTATLNGLQFGVNLLNASRPGVPKVIVIFTDGAANVPCDCNECTKYLGSQAACVNTQFYPGKTCADCAWNPSNNQWCMPCAEPRTYAQYINQIPGWKIVAIGVGDDNSPLPQQGWDEVQGLAYSPNAAFLIDWSQTQQIYQTIVDTACDGTGL